MPVSSLQELAAQFCAIINVRTPQLSADDDGVLAFSATVGEVDITVSHDPAAHPDEVSIDVFFGAVPADRELPILRELLRANRVMGTAQAPSFSLDVHTGEVVLRYVRFLADTDGERLWAGVQTVIDTVLQWRSTFFLEPDEAPPFDVLAVCGLDHLA